MNTGEKLDDTMIRTRSITKEFGIVSALQEVSFSCRKGEIHGLVGENGAGKSTLMKILVGEYPPDQGEIFLKEKKVAFKNPRQSREAGISLIHQELSLVPYLNVAENIFLGKEPRTRLRFIDSPRLYEAARAALKSLNLELDLHTPAVNLAIAQKQLIEIVKSLQDGPQILIMDEPTATLEQSEIDRLFALIKQIKDQGKTVIFISHRLEEIAEITDRITVLRNGKKILCVDTPKITKNELIEAIIGRKLEKLFPPKTEMVGGELITCKGLTTKGKLQEVNLTLRAGEILGIAGLEGQGQDSLLKRLFGADLSSDGNGEILFRGEKLNLSHPKDAVHVGFGYVPGDRRTEGLIMNLPTQFNISLPGLHKRAKSGFVDAKLEEEIFKKSVKSVSIKIASPNTLVKNLSGGNQQKVVLAKWLAADTDVFILDEPTRGVDIGTRAEIYTLLRNLANRGKGIIISSRDLDEVMGLSDRIAVISKGKIIHEFKAGEISKQEILDLITKGAQEKKESKHLDPENQALG